MSPGPKWVRLRTGFPQHPRIARLSDGAFRLHVSALCYSARHSTDGWIAVFAESLLHDHSRTRRLVQELVQAGLWEPGDSGWRIHADLDHQPEPGHESGQRLLRLVPPPAGSTP
jgi:hypothetical protein